jgi:hypothetical protein
VLDCQVKLDAVAPLTAIAAAQQAMREAEAAVRARVDHARRAGHTWQEIGDVLRISRQAAFQRFGRPFDAHTGKEALVVGDAEDRALTVATDLMSGRFDAVRRDFDERMAEAVDVVRLADVCAQVAATIGRFERPGTPFARQLGDFSVVDVPLHFEAGEATVRVSFAADARIAGLLLLPSHAD